MTVATPPSPPRDEALPAASCSTAPVEPEALIEEARRHQRRRRRRAAIATLLLAIGVAVLYFVLSAVRGDSADLAVAPPRAVAADAVELHLKGFGTPQPTTAGAGSCPAGRTAIQIASATGAPLGSADVCVLTIRKVNTPRGGPRQIVQTVIETDTLPGGTITSRQTQTIDFATDQSRSVETTATFTGTVIGGTGQYADARGTISGGGRGINSVADWRVTIDLR